MHTWPTQNVVFRYFSLRARVDWELSGSLAPVDLAATPFLRPPPLPLEQRPPVRFPGCRRGRPASLREGRTGSKLPNRGRDHPQVLCRNRHAYENNACRTPLPALRHRTRGDEPQQRSHQKITREPNAYHGTMEPWNKPAHSWTVSATKPCRGGPIAPGGRAVARVGFPHRSQLIKTGHHKGVPYIRPNSAQPYIRVVPCTSAACCTSAPPAPGWKLA